MNEELDSATKEKEETITKQPKMYNVILLNDNFTSFNFVMDILMGIFNHNPQSAEKVTLDIHNTEEGVCGIYVKTIAEVKADKTNKLAKSNGFPLKAIVKEA